MLDKTRPLKIAKKAQKLKIFPASILKNRLKQPSEIPPQKQENENHTLHYLSRKKSSDIVLKKNSKMLENIEHLQVGSIVNQLYPKIENAINQKQLKRIKTQWEGEPEEIDQFTGEQKLENKMSMKAAQRELDQRIKARTLQKSRKLTSQLSVSYLKAYEEIKRQFSKQKLNVQQEKLQYEQPQISPQGINYYSQLKNRPAILQFTRLKMQKKMMKQLSQKRTDLNSLSILALLNQRKRKNMNEQSQKTILQKIKKDSYDREMHNIQFISNRMKRIYSRRFQVKLNDKELQEVQHSTIRKEQWSILEELEGEGKEKINKFNKVRLINQFNQILNDFGKLSGRVREMKSKTQLLKIRSQKIFSQGAGDLGEGESQSRLRNRKIKSVNR